jgi:hypothetical protein
MKFGSALVIGAVGASLVMTGAIAQQQTVRVRGTIESIDGNMVMVKTRDGADMKLKLADNVRVNAVVPAKLADVKAGTMVGITSQPQADGSLRASEIHIFPAGQTVRQSHGPYDIPNSFMTNGEVQTSVAAVNGQTLTVSYKAGDKVDQKQITVTPQAIIVGYEPAKRADLKAGAKVFVANAAKLPDGTAEVASISYGKDGLTPPQ